jgi:serine/threonine-protein kinase
MKMDDALGDLVFEDEWGKVFTAQNRNPPQPDARPRLIRVMPSVAPDARVELDALVGGGAPGLATVRSVKDDGRACLVEFDRPDGEPLSKLLGCEPRLRTWPQACAIAVQVLSALEATTPLGATSHLAIHPARIWVDATRAFRITLTDVGLGPVVKAVRRVRPPSLDEARYTSPEVIDGGAVGERADVYATALLLYEMVAGESAIRTISARDALNAQCTQSIEWSPDVRATVPKGVVSALTRMLEKDPQKRPSRAEAIALLEPFAPQPQEEARESEEVTAVHEHAPATERLPGAPAAPVRSRTAAETAQTQIALPSVFGDRGEQAVPLGVAMLIVLAMSIVSFMTGYSMRKDHDARDARTASSAMREP